MHFFPPETEMKALLSQGEGTGIHTAINTISGKGIIRSDSRESSRLLWNPKVHYLVPNITPLDPIQSQFIPGLAHKSEVFTIILQYMPKLGARGSVVG
jgi:hypothetical protein